MSAFEAVLKKVLPKILPVAAILYQNMNKEIFYTFKYMPNKVLKKLI